MKKLFLASAAFAFISTGTAHAADFSGPFLGLNVGYSLGKAEFSYEDGTTGNGDFSHDDDLDGFEGGAFLGFRHQFSSGFNLGLEGGYDISGADGSYGIAVGANTFSFNYEKQHEWHVSLKPGFLIDEHTLGYGILGYQQAEFKGDLLLNGASLATQSDTFDGIHVGLGLERMIANNLSLRAEYKYNHYFDNDYNDVNGQQETWGGHENIFKVGVTYNFNVPQ